MRFGVTDLEIRDMGANILSRDEIFAQCDLLLICKVTVRDLMQARNGQIVCGWMHTTQQFEIAQIAIDKQLTLIAWENMYNEDPNNRKDKSIYIFNRNRELAGYAGIIHLRPFGHRRLLWTAKKSKRAWLWGSKSWHHLCTTGKRIQ